MVRQLGFLTWGIKSWKTGPAHTVLLNCDGCSSCTIPEMSDALTRHGGMRTILAIKNILLQMSVIASHTEPRNSWEWHLHSHSRMCPFEERPAESPNRLCKTGSTHSLTTCCNFW